MTEIIPTQIEFFKTHGEYIGGMTLVSIILFAGTLVIVPWLIVRLPADYFSHRSRREARQELKHPAVRLMIRISKNALGLFLIVAGLIMLFIPGQGLLTIGIGILLMDFPGKYRLEQWIVRHRPVIKSINRIRRRAHRPPLDL
ncbi:MAG: PGPGW domain-containing protein [Thermodesulfobacteriota bacterium]